MGNKDMVVEIKVSPETIDILKEFKEYVILLERKVKALQSEIRRLNKPRKINVLNSINLDSFKAHKRKFYYKYKPRK